MPRILSVLLLSLSLWACSGEHVKSIEDSIWTMFTGHPKPVVLKKPRKVYCYETIGQPDCYEVPREQQPDR